MEEILKNVGQYGFPMIITIYLLVRMEKKLDDLTKSIDLLSFTVQGKDKKEG